MTRALLVAAAIAAPATVLTQSKAQLDSAVPALMRAGEIPGISAAVVRNGALYWSGAFGVRNARTGDPVDRHTVFDAASLTKPVVAYAMLRLADRGIIDLDKPIAQLLPNARMQHDARYLRITPRHVLTHATGLPNWGGDRLDLSFDPGTSWGYSGEGFVWLSRAVEKVTGRWINDIVRDEVFTRLGMSHSSLVWNDALEANGAQPHNPWGRVSPRQRPVADSLNNANAAASLRTTAEDYAKFVIAAMNEKRLFTVQNEAFEAANYRNRPDSIKRRIAWGLGWGLERRGGGIMAWHWGDNGNAKAFVIAEPRGRSAVVYFANSQNGLAIANALTSMVFPGEQGALSWIRYEQHSEPARIARRTLVRAGFDSGVAGVVKRYVELCARTPSAVDGDVVRAAANDLAGEQLAAADTLLALGARDFPSAQLVMARADMHLTVGANARLAARYYDQVLAVTPSDSTARFRARWSREVAAAIENPFKLADGAAERLVGAYGPRNVMVENGKLFYQRTGNRKFALVPMSHDTFVLDGNPGFKAQFVTEQGDRPNKIVGWYYDGQRDETARTPALPARPGDTIFVEVGSSALDASFFRDHAARVRVYRGDTLTAEWVNQLTMGDSAGRRVMRWVTTSVPVASNPSRPLTVLRQTYDARSLAPLGYSTTSSTGAFTKLAIDGTRIRGNRKAANDTSVVAVETTIERPGFFAGASDLVPVAAGLRQGLVLVAPVWSPGRNTSEDRVFAVTRDTVVNVEGTPQRAWKVEERRRGDRSIYANWYLLRESPYMVYGEIPLPDGRMQRMTEVVDTVQYTILTPAGAAGVQNAWIDSSGARMFYMTYNDRGRGPSLTQRVVLGADGFPRKVEISGHDYLKAPVSETYVVEGNTARWKNTGESDSVTFSRPAYYLPFYDVSLGIFEGLLLKSPTGKIPLLPQGEARIEKISELTLTGPQPKKLTLYANHGLWMTPATWWADEQGQFFAAGGSWFMIIRKGFESARGQLIKATEAYDAARGTALAKKIIRTPGRAVVFRNARVFDSEKGTVRPRTTVVVNGNRITAVGADGSVRLPANAEMIDVGGKSLLPGLWDMHVHAGDDNGMLFTAAGITTVRDLANDTDETLRRKKRFDSGELAGPRMILAGFMDGPGPFAGPTKVLISTADSARAWVNRYADLGYEQIKVYSSLDTSLVAVVVQEAHKRGLRVSGHVPQGMTAQEFVEHGADEIQHVNFLFLNFWRDTVKDTRTPERFTGPAQRAALLDLNSPRVQSFIRLLKQRGTVIDPTVSTFEGMLTARPGKMDAGSAIVADRLPPLVRRGLLAGGLQAPDSLDQRYRDSFTAFGRMVKAMYDAGVTIVAGTDEGNGYALHRELELYAQAGIPPVEALRMATIIPARVMKRDRELGSIAVGKLADLIIVDGQPDVRMSDIRRVTFVMKDGKVYDPVAVYQAVGIRPIKSP